jgi:hypothetical protein
MTVPYIAKLDDDSNQRMRVDRDLIRLFLAMSPEQRLATNDNAIRAIEELRNAFKKRKPASGESQRFA